MMYNLSEAMWWWCVYVDGVDFYLFLSPTANSSL